MDILRKNGAVKEYASLDALAQAYGMNPEALKQTFADFNKAIESGKDREFGRKLDKDIKPLTHAPYYVSEMSPKIHHTMGGIATDTSTRVLSVVDENRSRDFMRPVNARAASTVRSELVQTQ